MVEFDEFGNELEPQVLSKEENDFLQDECVTSLKQKLLDIKESKKIKPNNHPMNLKLVRSKLAPIVHIQNMKMEHLKRQINENNSLVEMIRRTVKKQNSFEVDEDGWYLQDNADELIEDLQDLKDEGVLNPKLSGNVLKIRIRMPKVRLRVVSIHSHSIKADLTNEIGRNIFLLRSQRSPKNRHSSRTSSNSSIATLVGSPKSKTSSVLMSHRKVTTTDAPKTSSILLSNGEVTNTGAVPRSNSSSVFITDRKIASTLTDTVPKSNTTSVSITDRKVTNTSRTALKTSSVLLTDRRETTAFTVDAEMDVHDRDSDTDLESASQVSGPVIMNNYYKSQ
ncbi:hypothetical protein HELRODRAFT_180529 [Helobdella robusta]|uniref:Uncharacterized protein n=1 Tax=Helobdella robusta TaxID=6412 RepID=T1FG09_HELRO|nr:hypothetical protein HELRODRAFT_180529 [Helobdella robusta]ESN93876.1 hypothetical protein HELRODRAFT_180529 [Helobdella robusta]